MNAFEHVIVLLSFVYALALTQVLSRVGALIEARERVRFSWLAAGATMIAVMLVFINWISLWDLRSAAHWGMVAVAVQFCFALVIYGECYVSTPAAPEDGVIDMEAHYQRQRVPFYGLGLLSMVLATAGNAQFLDTARPELFLNESLPQLPVAAPMVIALAVRRRWVHALCIAAMLCAGLFFLSGMTLK